MKDNLFEMLMNFFEKSLSKITEKKSRDNDENDTALRTDEQDYGSDNQSLVIRPARNESMRVFTYEEQTKFTKASYQFLMRMLVWGIIAPESMELIINQLLFSESRYITLEETKWTIRSTLANHLDASQLVFLDMVLYQKEDELPLH